MVRLGRAAECWLQVLVQAVSVRLVWVVVVDAVELLHCAFAADGRECRVVLESSCVEMREAEAFGGNADSGPSSWVALRATIRRDGASMGWRRLKERTARQCHTNCG